MSLKDFEAFIRERVLIWDSSQDVEAGSPFDTEVVQPLLGRIGTDPFSTNLPLFLRERLAQEFPDHARGDGGAIPDLLMKPVEILMDPLIREINRVALSQSVADPSLLTIEEAEAIMANLFSERQKGTLSRGVVRLYFSSPRSAEVNPADYCLSKRGYIFNPVSVQSIRQDEMLLNTEGSLYYFDINVEAEVAGDQYNIDPDEIVNIANLTGVVRATNKRRFRSGTPAENAVEYIGRAEQELSEKSLVALRGILSVINRNFPEVTRVAVVGHGDPEMGRDVIKGGSLGPIIAVGTLAKGWADGNHGTYTSRIRVEDVGVDFQVLIGPVGPSEGYALTLYGAFDAGEDIIQDVGVAAVVDSTTIELDTGSVLGSAQNIPWALRKKSITLGDIPGGILFPDGPNGTVEVLEDEVHIGGCTDLYVRSTGFSQGTLTIEAVADDEPALQGNVAYYSNVVSGAYAVVLADFEYYNLSLGNEATSNYFLREGDPIYELLAGVASNGFVFRVLAPAHNAGTYRVLRVIQDPNAQGSDKHPVVLLDRSMSSPIGPSNPLTWRVQDDVDVDLTGPKETKWEGTDLRTYTGQPYVDTASGVDFDSLGVVTGDILRILGGNNVGDYTLASNPLGPGYTQLQLTENLSSSEGGISFEVYRANQSGGIDLPLIRVTSVDMLDTSSQPVGSQIPYGSPVYCRSNAFSNAARGTKLEVWDACIGIVGAALEDGPSGEPEVLVDGSSIKVEWYVYWTLDENFTYKKQKTISLASISLPSPRVTLQEVVDQINAALISEVGVQVSAAHVVDGRRLGIAPIGLYTEVWDSDYSNPDSAYKLLFGVFTADVSGTPGYKRWQPPMTSRDVRSDTVSNIYLDPNADDEWFDDKYDIDRAVDGVDLRDGIQSGHYSIMPTWHPLQPVQTLTGYVHIKDQMDVKIQLTQDMNPEADVHTVVGSRSIGTARLYFLEPVTIEFDAQSTFTVTNEGIDRVYFPDPSINTSKVPGYPNTEELDDGSLTIISGSANTDYGYINSDSANFYETGVKVGDLVRVRYEDLFGDVDLPENIPDLSGTKLVLSVNNSADIAIEIEETSFSLGVSYVSRDDLVTQINTQLGMNIAEIASTQGGALTVLALSADVPVVVRYNAGAEYANSVLGMATLKDRTNRARCEGTYTVQNLSSDTRLVCRRIEGAINWPSSDPIHGSVPQHLAVLRGGAQRFSSTLVNDNVGTAGLYYADIELVSRGVGDEFNIAAGFEMQVDEYLSYGYRLDAENQDLTFSALEVPYLRLPPVFFPVGTSDEVQNAITVVGQNLQVTYDTTSVIDSVQDFVNNELDRVTCANILVRHLLPHFVSLDITYSGGSKASQVQEDLENFIEGLFPNQPLQADDIIAKIKNRGATAVTGPIDVIAVVHSEDRKIWLDWSQDSINAGRLAAFFADNISLTRQSS